jgi:hypothetical protein
MMVKNLSFYHITGNPMEKPTWSKVGQNILQYGLFIVFGAGALGVLLLVRTDLLLIGSAFNATNQVLWIMDLIGMFVFGGLFLVALALMESYLRAGMKEHNVWRRARRLIVIEAIAGIVSYGVTLLI